VRLHCAQRQWFADLLYNRGQWDVVGVSCIVIHARLNCPSHLTFKDTFVVGCAFSDKIIYPETFVGNPDATDPVYSSEFGVYKPHCGLDNVMLSWGHDEYLYHVLKEQSSLPEDGLHMIRYHSFYPYVPQFDVRRRPCSVGLASRWHREGAYEHLCNESDKRALKAVQAFNPYDLYSKTDESVDPTKLRPYYEGLIAKFFPEVIEW
jgi:inositol oxygenase